VSLPEDDAAYLDERARKSGTPSRSAVLHEAVRMLRSIDLEADYAAAWHEGDSTGEREEWQSTSGDGLR
jgi:Arc/MetJ-type ribon-helix-helix transcriptional regulator